MSSARVERFLSQALTALEAGLAPLRLLSETPGTELRPRELAVLRDPRSRDRAFSELVSELGWVESYEVSILRAGEAGGTLDHALRSVVASVASRRKARAATYAMLAYPSGLVIAAALIGPLPLVVTAGVGAWAAAAFPLVAIVVSSWVVALFVWPLVPAASPLRSGLGRIADRVPGLGTLRHHRARARMLLVLARSLEAGLGLREAAGFALESSGSLAASVSPVRFVRDAERAGLAGAMGTARLLEPWQLAIVANAETTGSLPASLEKLSHDLEESANRLARTLSIVATVAVFVGVAGWIGTNIVRGFSDVLREVDQAIESQMY